MRDKNMDEERIIEFSNYKVLCRVFINEDGVEDLEEIGEREYIIDDQQTKIDKLEASVLELTQIIKDMKDE